VNYFARSATEKTGREGEVFAKRLEAMPEGLLRDPHLLDRRKSQKRWNAGISRKEMGEGLGRVERLNSRGAGKKRKKPATKNKDYKRSKGSQPKKGRQQFHPPGNREEPRASRGQGNRPALKIEGGKRFKGGSKKKK